MRFLPMFVIVLFALTSGYLTLAEHDSPSGKPVTQHLVWGLHAIILGTLIRYYCCRASRFGHWKTV